jgi:reactive intermediate/imine deaminase
MSELRYINPSEISAPPGYSQGIHVVSGQPVYISGQVPYDSDGNLVGTGDIEAQLTQVFKNLQTVLTVAGSDFAHVVKFTFFLTNIDHLGTLREVRDRFIDAERPPASSVVEVGSLFHEDVMIEIEAVAVVPAADA